MTARIQHRRATFRRWAIILVPRHRSLVIDAGTHAWYVQW